VLTLGIMLRNPNLIPLSRQHHNGLSLCVLTERSLRSDSSIENIRRLAERAVARYEIEIRNHFELEETLLFPAAIAHLGPWPLVEQLVAEHRRLEGYIGELRTSPDRAALEAFTALLAGHIRLEERELFEQIQDRLPEEVLASLGREFEARAVRVCL
jgi:hemerythrin-like domain-containing protein